MQQIHKRKLPVWATEETIAKAKELWKYVQYVNDNDTTVVRLKSGGKITVYVLVKQISATIKVMLTPI